MADMWHIVSQVQEPVISDTGPGFDHVWEITYMVDSGPATGTRGKVRVPVDRYNSQTVRNAVDAAVYHIDQVASL